MKKILLAVMAITIVFGATATGASAATGFALAGSFAVQQLDGDVVHQRRIAVNHATGDVYVADQQHDRVSVYRPNASGADPLTDFGTGQLIDPYGIAIDQDSGTVYVSDVDGVTKYDSDGAATPTFTADAGFATITGTGPLAFDQDADELLLADTTANVVRRYSADGAVISTFDGIGSPATFTGLQDLAVDSTGDIVVVDAIGDPGTGGISRIERFDGTGTWKATLPSVDQAATVGIVPETDVVVVGGNQDAVDANEFPTLRQFGADGSDLGTITLADEAIYSTISGIAIDDGETGRLNVATDASAGSYPGQWGITSIQTYDAVRLPTVTVGSATGVAATSATLHGTVAPGGENASYRFEHSANSGTTWTSAPGPDGDAATDDSAGNGNGAVTVQAEITGLEPNSAYQFRLVATNRASAVVTSPQSFTTNAAAPIVDTQPAKGITKTSARIIGTVDPQGSPTRYWFEYGTSTDYGTSIPVGEDADAGTGNAAIEVTRTITGLTPNTTYHYRVVAKNSQGTASGSDRTLTPGATTGAPEADKCPNASVRAQQGAAFLPDCRAFELVSPARINGVDASRGDFAQANADGTIIGFTASDGFENAENGVGTAYRAVRSNAGWASRALSPPLDPNDSPNPAAESITRAFSSDLSLALLIQGSHRAAPGAPPGVNKALYVRDAGDGSLTRITASEAAAAQGDPTFYVTGVSPSFAHIVFEASLNNFGTVTPGPIKLVAGDADRVGGGGLYDYSNGRLNPVGILPNGDVPPNGAVTPFYPQNTDELTGRNAVSRDGRRIMFMTPDPLSGSAATPLLYQRIDGDRTVLVSKSMITGDSATEAAGFEVASPDGSKVWFTTPERLTNNAPVGGTKVYRFDSDTQVVTYEPDLDQGPVVTSDDGSRVFFIKAGTEELWTRNDGAVPTKVANVDFSYVVFRGARVIRSNDDGTEFAFVLRGDPVPGEFNNAGGFAQLYSFNEETGKLACASCPPEGVLPAGDAALGRGRTLAGDQNSLYFSTPTALVPRDVNGVADVYQWRAGVPRLITDGTSKYPSTITDVSPREDSVVFVTRNKLDSRDDGGLDVYAARVDGGIPLPPAPTSCDLDCQGPASVHPKPAEPGSSQPGGGNPASPSRKARGTISVGKPRAVSGTTATLRVQVSSAGRISLTGSSIRSVGKSVRRAATYSVKVSLSARGSKLLYRKGRLRAVVEVAFKSGGYTAVARKVVVTFKKPHRGSNSKGNR